MGSIAIGEALSLLMFFGIIGVLLLGFPVAFTLPGVALIFALIGHAARRLRPLQSLEPGAALPRASCSTTCWWRCRCSSSWA